ncbi:hypothetical protein [Vibrio methylphosphonaticus]|uniref:hypothetical protein n=1 Tax=Vibrio methylphosphonaticus TaxID=2946866 RepID=UPI00202A316A|nr:hypothetical protein [Vibrio methylphosphonaticus]MCL9775643.1 hypothetical protein [Vibrio methylphosphonaticus]
MRYQSLFVTAMMLWSTASYSNGGALVDPHSNLAFDYDNVTQDVAQAELNECVSIASQVSTQPETQTRGSGARGAAKGAAAGAVVGSVSGNSGTDAAKTGAAIGVVGGRLSARQESKANQEAADTSYKTVLRNCMLDKHYVALN